MADIRFETGLKEFSINGTTKVLFCPTDMNFIEKVYKALDNMDAKQEQYRQRIDSVSDEEVFDLAREMDSGARNEINAIFDSDICTPVFGNMSVLAVADGFPIWANFLLAIIDTLDGEFAAEKKKTNPRIAKYTAKYKKK